jgi:AcrR family transcriptional regulator
MKTKTSRGRPREYDPEEALAAALGEFRRRGYTATSLDHLSDATRMARPSLYAAFGNKLEIYRKAVRQYSEQSVEQRRRALFDEPSLEKGLREYFGHIVGAYHSREGEPLGCPVLSVISGEAAADPEIGAELAAAVGKTDSLFLKRVTLAAEAGEIAPGADVAGLATMLAALQHSLALRARAGTPRPELLAIAHAHIALVLKAAGVGGSKTTHA